MKNRILLVSAYTAPVIVERLMVELKMYEIS